MRVRAAGSSGVTTVNAVQTTAEGETRGDKRRRTKRTKGTQEGGTSREIRRGQRCGGGDRGRAND